MLSYIRGRLLQTAITLLVMSMVAFGLQRLTGDPTYLLVDQNAPLQEVERVRRVYGLDQPLPVQYVRWISDLARGDLGTSLRAKRPVAELIGERPPNTLSLALIITIFSTMVAVPLGILAAVRRGGTLDRVCLAFAALCQSVPGFWLAIVGILVFSVQFRWLPVAGSGGPQHYVLPVVSVSLGLIAVLFRLIRSNMLEVLTADYVRYARVKGLREVTVLGRHALPNAIIPVVTVIGIVLSALLSGLIVVETVFAWPGVGTLAQQAIAWRDYPLMQGWLLGIMATVSIINLVVDVLYGYIDPRLRLGH